MASEKMLPFSSILASWFPRLFGGKRGRILAETGEERDLSDAAFLAIIYRDLLGREIDPAGLEHFSRALAAGHSRTSVLLAITRSDEFIGRAIERGRIRHEASSSLYDADATMERSIVRASVELADAPDDASLKERYLQLWQKLFDDNADDYLLVHRQRYFELFSGISPFIRQKPSARILEIGPSVFLPLYRELFPAIELITCDRPGSMDGESEDYFRGLTAISRHYSVDLGCESLSPAFGQPPLGYFDLVICTEVLEHLMVNPIDFLQSLLSLLKPDGFVYLTTPNFFSLHNRRSFESGENPQHVFPGHDRNRDQHHHMREYSMRELLRFSALAGGRVVNSSFSTCWDDQAARETVLIEHPEWRSSIVMFLTRTDNPSVVFTREPGE